MSSLVEKHDVSKVACQLRTSIRAGVDTVKMDDHRLRLRTISKLKKSMFKILSVYDIY